MKFAIRADASLQIGTGHVMRCLTLAKALQDSGAKCTFICREHEGNLIEKIRQEGVECIVLPQRSEIPEKHDADGPILAHAEWLGASWKSDARETIQALRAEEVDWLVIDHYALDQRWEEMLGLHVKKILVIDDLADRFHDCHLLLDQNLVDNFEMRYQHLLPDRCETLLGPQYALLQAKYAELYPRTRPRTGPVKRIMVFFGGADQHNLTGYVISVFLNLKRDDIELDVVLSPNSPHNAGIQALARQHPNLTLHDALPSLATLMLQADLAIGAGGSTSWERCCLGLPSLVITLAENQKPIAAELHKQGLVHWVGHYDVLAQDILLDALQSVIDDKNLENWSRACMAVTSGEGVSKVLIKLSSICTYE